MANKYTALLLLVCFIVAASVDADLYTDYRKRCLTICHERGCFPRGTLCNLFCYIRCLDPKPGNGTAPSPPTIEERNEAQLVECTRAVKLSSSPLLVIN
ncbi:hypothetical protein AAZX31_10G234300 [Glycine max]